MNEKTTENQCMTAYEAIISQIDDMLTELQQMWDACFGADPKNITWNDVHRASFIAKRLDEVLKDVNEFTDSNQMDLL
nr:hypothetical protein 18 [bacterium]